MNEFICHKKVKATPMNRQQYNDYRGWELPSDEDGSDEGYLVEYIGSPNGNHPDHMGYISWSPKKVFEEGYALPKDKVSPEHISSLMDSLTYKFARVEGTTVTGCWSFLPSGFQIGYGESACVNPDNYKWEDGCKYAKERCEQVSQNKLWELEGYLLATTGLTSESF